ncbi:hypothetical protein [Cohnella sp. 56]|uniref:hypothetical protein n=1 Tax=Cohnella sp. 56 TaxID=3113722 RepID=UPI0030E78E1F
MAQKTKPDVDTDRAWARFERLAAGEPVPAFWRQAHDGLRAAEPEIAAQPAGIPNLDEKEGGDQMKHQAMQEAPAAGAAVHAGAAGTGGTGGRVWRTERPARRRLRRLTAGLAAVSMTVGLLATPLGDRAMSAMLQSFRVQHVVGVGITADDMAKISGLLERGSPDGDQRFDLAQYGSLTQSGGGEERTVSWAEAGQRMGASLLRPDDAAAPVYQPAVTLTFRLNVKAVNRLLVRLGSGTTLPAAADGQAIRLHIPGGVSTEGSLGGKPVRLLQFGKPELTVEGGIDAAAVREAVLGLPVLPDSLRTKLAAIGDWQSTLPVPARDGATVSLRLNGHDAVMTTGDSRRFVLWLSGDRMSLLSGATADFPAEADFKRAAEALIRP